MKFEEMMKNGGLEEMVKNVSSCDSIKGGGRKGELLGKLKEGIYSVKELSGMIGGGISSRNVSSLVCYLRDDGYEIKKLNRGNDIGLVLWSRIVEGKKDGNRMVLGDKGKIDKFVFDKGCFESEVVEEVVEEKKVVKKK